MENNLKNSRTNLEALAQNVVTLAKSLGKTFTFAESCTGGLLAKCITDTPGASVVFLGSIVSYSDTVKNSILKVSSETLASHTAVSKECAEEMARGALTVITSDIAISVTGYAGPDGGTREDPLGTVYLGIATKSGEVKVIRKNYSGSRRQVREAATITALEALLQALNETKS